MGGRLPSQKKKIFEDSEFGVLGVLGVLEDPMRLFLSLDSIWRDHPWERRCSGGVPGVLWPPFAAFRQKERAYQKNMHRVAPYD